MHYLIEIKSDENKDFLLLVQIDAEATFLDLHRLIMENCQYDDSQMASFFTLAAQRQRLQEIGLFELSSEDEEMNIAVMDVATLREFVGEDIKQLEYQFDFFGDRYFNLEIKEIHEGSQAQPVVLIKEGTPPEQILTEGFEDLDLGAPKDEGEKVDYEKYLSEFDDCGGEDVDFQSLDDLDEDFY